MEMSPGREDKENERKVINNYKRRLFYTSTSGALNWLLTTSGTKRCVFGLKEAAHLARDGLARNTFGLYLRSTGQGCFT